ITAPASQVSSLKAELANTKSVGVLPSDVNEEPAVTAAAQAARGSAGTPVDQTMATAFATTALSSLLTLTADHASVYRVEDAQPALTDALKDKRPEIATASATVLGRINNA